MVLDFGPPAWRGTAWLLKSACGLGATWRRSGAGATAAKRGGKDLCSGAPLLEQGGQPDLSVVGVLASGCCLPLMAIVTVICFC